MLALRAVGALGDAITLYRCAHRDCCDLMSAFEFMPPIAFDLAREAMPDLAMPMEGGHPAYVLMEISGSGLVDIEDLIQRFLEGVMTEVLALGGVIAASRTQAKNLWLFREGMNEGQARRGPHSRTDVSMPLSRLPEFVEKAEAVIAVQLPDCLCVSCGHVCDGNVHPNVLPPGGLSRDEIAQRIYAAKGIINGVLDGFGGSISAEHGIGRLKKADFLSRVPATQLQLLTAIKRAIEPAGIMNPGCQLNCSGDS